MTEKNEQPKNDVNKSTLMAQLIEWEKETAPLLEEKTRKHSHIRVIKPKQ